MPNLPARWREVLERETKNESVLWTGRPQTPTGRVFIYAIIPTLIFSVIGFAGLYFAGSMGLFSQDIRKTLLDVWVTGWKPYGVMALGLFFAFCIYIRVKMNFTLYVITDKHMFDMCFFGKFQSKRLKPTSQMILKVKQHTDGTGNLAVDREVLVKEGMARESMICFWDVLDPHTVESLLRKAFEWRSEGGATTPKFEGGDKQEYFSAHIGEVISTSLSNADEYEWEIIKCREQETGLDVVVRSKDGDVGYNPVRLIIRFEPTKFPKVTASYIQSKKSGWDLLSSKRGSAPAKHLEAF